MKTIKTLPVLFFSLALVLISFSSSFSADRLIVENSSGDEKLIIEDTGAVMILHTGAAFGLDAPSATQGRFLKRSDAGEALLDFSPLPMDGTGGAKVRFFRATNTTGEIYFAFYHGDGTSTLDHRISAGGGNSYFQRQGGNFGIGENLPTQPLHMGSGAYCSSGGTWFNASSRAYKENIVSLSSKDAIATVKQLNPVSFTYKTEPSESRLGFIAEDVPAMVASKDRKGMSSMDVVAVLTKVVQEQQAP